ncbi:MAG: GGDEF domain-containing protein [Armatimonadetes bacterium]|nr:MAG: GGDEF domain-containing protein [Armatimonadota bacterium]
MLKNSIIKNFQIQRQKKLIDYYRELAEQLTVGELSADEFSAKQAKKHLWLESLADYDSLIPGFYNQGGFNKTLDRTLSTLKRLDITGSLLFLDVDRLKRFNDKNGHPAGSELLRIYGRVMEQEVRKSDLKGRVGGDEFALFLVGADKEKALMVAERIRSGIITEVEKIFPKLEWKQTISIGVSQVKENDTVESLLKRADQALYKAKEKRNRTEVFN